jgi:hypothetical protein
LGYHTGPVIGEGINFGRDYDNTGDILLGNVAAKNGWQIRISSIKDLPALINDLTKYQPY